MVVTRSQAASDTAARVNPLAGQQHQEQESPLSPQTEDRGPAAAASGLETTVTTDTGLLPGASVTTGGAAHKAASQAGFSLPAVLNAKTVSRKSSHQKELLMAREALIEKEIQLQAAREARLQKEVQLQQNRLNLIELDSDDNDDDELSVVSIERHRRTKEWVEKQPLEESHPEAIPGEGAKGNERPQTPESHLAPQPQAREGKIINLEDFTTAMTGAMTAIVNAAKTSAVDTTLTAAMTTMQAAVSTAQAAAERSAQAAERRELEELPKFSGRPMEWLPFSMAYEATAPMFTELQNISRLRRSIVGPARDAAHAQLGGRSTAAKIMEFLESKFGRTEALIDHEVGKLTALPRMGENPKDICIFADKVTNIVTLIESLGGSPALYNPTAARAVVNKMSAHYQMQYAQFSREHAIKGTNLIKVNEFLRSLAGPAGDIAPIEPSETENRREKSRGNRTTAVSRTYHANVQAQTDAPKKPECRMCKEEHRPTECPTIKKANPDERWDLAREHRLCFRCLHPRKFRHQCKLKKCGINGCTGSHHQLLHGYTPREKPAGEKRPVQSSPPSPEKEEVVTSAREVNASALLKVLPVRVTGPAGSCDTFALLDDGSTCTLIDEALAQEIGAQGRIEPFYIEGVGGAKVEANQSRRVRFDISGQDSRVHTIMGRTIDKLDLATQTVSSEIARRFSHLRDLEQKIAYGTGRPSILIGQDNWHLLLAHEVRKGEQDQPIASLTDLGWVLHGVRQAPQHAHRVFHIRTRSTEEDEMEKMMREHFALEALGVTPRRSYTEDEQRALQILEVKTKRLPAGGFETGLLWREDDPTPPDNYDAAFKRLQLIEKKLDKDPQLKERYNKQMEVLFENDYAEPAPQEKSKRTWYLPHFAVINPQKPQKLRIVHDAAARTRGVSLNDMLLSGPDLLQSLPGVLMRFRQWPVAVTADIKDMFMRVQVIEEDRDMQRFLWRGDRRTGAPTEYRMKSVIFGATSSPCTAIYVKNVNAEHFKEEFPEAAAAIVNNHYVDDYLASFDDEDEAIRVSSQVTYIHSRANYFLQRWASNSRNVISNLSPGKREDIVALDAEKILGMVWHPETDTLTFNLNRHKIPADVMNGEKTPTKREALRTVMSIFDPLGLATPVTIQAKRILQDTWRSGIEWDEALHDAEDARWKSWVSNIQRLQQLIVPRCYPYLSTTGETELHVFVDASTSTYAAAVYWRVEDQPGRVHVSLIAGKGRVAPLNKVTSIPRLELQAAVLGCRLARTAIEEHDVKPTRRIFWSDSRTVLAWLRTGPRAYKPFVAHRVAEIAEETKTKEWRWVPTKDNVADDVTRETPSNFTSDHRWFRGPAFLYEPEEAWPREEEQHRIEDIEEAAAEERTHVVVTATCLKEALPEISRFSNYQRVIRATARVVQFIERLRERQRCTVTYKRTAARADADATWRPLLSNKKKKMKTIFAVPEATHKFVPLEVRHVRRATELWIRSQQEEVFGPDIVALRRGATLPSNSRLTSLAVNLDQDGILRLKSRIARAADITICQSEPAIVDGEHPWTQLYIAWVHRQLHHAGFEATTTEVRQQYWVLRLRYAVRSVIKRCLVCRIRRATPTNPSTGNHPVGRLAHHQRPFTYTGLDYFGPLYVTVGRGTQKRYGALFTCLTTRAVHIEVAGSLSTDSAIMALRRFIARRGCPTEIWSDQGTNLKGADIELKKAAQEAMQEEATVRGIAWRYIPPSAPFMGGAWERLVRSVKTALEVTLHERAPKEEVLTTLMAEAEHTINSRPLTHVSTSPDDEEPLTPNHFLLGGPSRVPQPGTFTDGDMTGRKEWRTSQRLADMFWARWVKEYLPELQHRREPRATGRAIQEGDLVLIADGTLPRNQWPRGVVVKLFPGPDGEVRAVDVRTTKGILRRPTKKLVLLPGPNSESE